MNRVIRQEAGHPVILRVAHWVGELQEEIMNKLQRTVLVIEPQEEGRLAIRQALYHTTASNYHVIEAADDAQALIGLQQQPDCLLLAIQTLDDENAPLLQQLVAQAVPQIYPVVLLVKDAGPALTLPTGAHDFLLKTEITPFALTRAINHACDKVALLRQLAAQRTFNQIVLESSPDCVKLLDGEGCLLSMNTPGLCLMEIEDFSPLTGQPWMALWPPESSTLILTALAEARAGRQGRFQAFCPTAKGTPKWWDVIVTAVNHDRSAPIRFIAASRDITESYQWADALRTSEERLRLGMTVAGLAIAEIDYPTNQIHLSPEAATLFGLPAASGAVPRGTIHALFHPADCAELFRRIDSALDPTGPGWFAMVHRIIRPDGVTRWLRVRKQIFFTQNANGSMQPERALLAAIDVTEQKEAEEALRRSEERYRDLFESMDEGFCVLEVLFDADHRPVDYRFLEVNPAFARFTGLTDAVGKTARELVPNLEQHWVEIYGNIARSGEARRFVEGSAAMGRWFDVYAFRVGGPNSPRVALLFNNITERKRAEEALRASEEQLRQITDNVPGLISVVNEQGEYEMVNQNYQRWLGLEPKQVIGQSLPAVLGGGDAYRVAQPNLQRALAGETVTFENRLTTLQGAPLEIMTTYMPRRDSNGRVTGCYILAIDITERKRMEEALRAGEERLRLALEAAQMGAWEWRPQSDQAIWSAQNFQIFGLEPDPADQGPNHHAFLTLLHPDDRNRYQQAIDQLLAGAPRFAEQLRIYHPNGSQHWIAGHAQMVQDESGQGVRIIGVTQDITEAKRREAEQHFLADLGEMMVSIQDPDELLWRVAQALAEFLAVSRCFFTEIDRQQGQMLIHRNYHPAALPSLAGIYPLADFEPRHVAAHEAGRLVVLADISPEAVAATSNPERYAPTQIRAMVSAPLLRNGQWTATLIVSDHQPRPWSESEIALIQTVAERAWLAVENRRLFQETNLLLAQVQEGQRFLQQSEETARQRLAELEAIYDSAPIGLCVLDRDLRWVRINERLAEINGFSVQEHLGHSVRELLPELAPTAEPFLRMILADDGPMLNLELQGQTPAQPGVERTWVEHMFPLHDSDGAVIGINIVAEEITERKRQERELQELNATLERRVADRTQQVEEKNRELERSNSELDKFAYVASHDLKSPLRAIDNLSQWIKEDAGALLPEPSQEHLAKLQGRVRRMEKLLDDLLIYSRVGRLQYTPEEVDLKALLQNLIALLQPSAAFTITVAEPLPILRTQRVPLETVLRNLLDNAIKHHERADGHVHLAAYDQGDWIEFVICDDGPGIDPQFHNRIFEVFQTLQPRDKVEGSGMGLAIVKKSIESQGGTITVESAPGAGATFRFTWWKG
jgi:PAS domain S-box-containing protein